MILKNKVSKHSKWSYMNKSKQRREANQVSAFIPPGGRTFLQVVEHSGQGHGEARGLRTGDTGQASLDSGDRGSQTKCYICMLVSL